MRLFRSLGFVVVIVLGFAATVFGLVRWVPFGNYPGKDFFDLAVQTIPILLVALAVEAQARQFDREGAGKRIRVAAVILLALGQTAAILISASLYVPKWGVESDVFVVTTAAGLLGGFLAVIVIAVKTPRVPVLGLYEPAPTTSCVAAQNDGRKTVPIAAALLIGLIVASAVRKPSR